MPKMAHGSMVVLASLPHERHYKRPVATAVIVTRVLQETWLANLEQLERLKRHGELFQ